jgi:tetratricopeptide (TPR) repeat protein
MSVDQYQQKIKDLFLDKYKFAYKQADREVIFQSLIEGAKKKFLNAYTTCFEGYLAWVKEDFKLAQSNFNKSIKLDEKISYTWNGLGNLYIELENYDKAIECYNKSIYLDANFVYPYNGLGVVYHKLTEYENAILWFQKAIRLDKKYAAPWHNLGRLYAELKEYKDAMRCYKKAIEVDENYAYPWNGIGRLFNNLNELQKAKYYYEKAIQLDPESFIFLFNLGSLLYELGEYSDAKIYLMKNIQKKDINEYFLSRTKDLLDRIQKQEDSEKRAAQRRELRSPLEKVLFTTMREKLAEEAAQNQRYFHNFLIEADNYEEAPSKDYLLVLRRWNSYTPIVADNFHMSKGGGYFLKVDNIGIVIDPGFNFIDNFRSAGRLFHEIDAVLVSHAHNDHTADLESILTLLDQYNREIKDSAAPNKEDTIRREIAERQKVEEDKIPKEEIDRVFLSSERRKIIDFYMTASVFKKYGGLFDLFSKNDYCLHIIEPNDEKQLGPGVKVNFISAKHEDIISDRNSVGLYIQYKDNLVLIYTGDTGWNNDIEQQYKEIKKLFPRKYRLLLAHMGGVKKEEEYFLDLKEKAFYPNHLGRLGLVRINEALKPHICIISEFGEELREWRQKIADIYQDSFDNKILFVPGDIGLEFNLKNRKIMAITRINIENKKLIRGYTNPKLISSVLLRKDYSLHYFKKDVDIKREDLVQIIDYHFEKTQR